ncbi:MAG: hypothetical protein ACOY94_06120 [Bacillota bacterium]
MHQLELDQSLTERYRAFAHAAYQAGQALLDKARVPFDPDPPFRWSKIPMEEVNHRVEEIREWAEVHGLLRPGQADHDKALHDLKLAGHDLLEETRRRSR